MEKYKKVFKVFFAGQEDEECEWLSKMSRQGYHLENVSFGAYYTFKQGEPKDYTYMIDMREEAQINEREYMLAYEEHGIEYIDTSMDFYYFRGESDLDTVSLIKSEGGRYLSRIKAQKRLILSIGLFNVIIFIFNLWNGIMLDYSVISYSACINLTVGIVCLAIYFSVRNKENKLREHGVKEPYKTSIKDWPKFYTLSIIIIALMVVYGGLVLVHFLEFILK